MFGTKSLNDEHDCNVIRLSSLNTHDSNDMESHKLGDAIFDELDVTPRVVVGLVVCSSSY